MPTRETWKLRVGYEPYGDSVSSDQGIPCPHCNEGFFSKSVPSDLKSRNRRCANCGNYVQVWAYPVYVSRKAKKIKKEVRCTEHIMSKDKELNQNG